MGKQGLTSSAPTQFLSSRLKAIVERAAKEAQVSWGFLLISDQNTPKMRKAAWCGWEEAVDNCADIAQWVMSTGKPTCLLGEAEAREITGSSPGKNALPLICVPLINNAGVLAIGSPYSAFEEFWRWLPTITSLAELAGVFLEIDALSKENYQKGEQLRNLFKNALESQEAERERICLEVHDGVAQTLVSAFQYLQTLQSLSSGNTSNRQLVLKISTLVRQAIQESREVINSIQPAALRELGLLPTLSQEILQLEKELGWKIDFSADDATLPRDMEVGVYRIIHEAITNARKHANTKYLRIRITSADDQVKVEVRDWGVGFNYDSQDILRKRRTGLYIMQKRAELLRGVCKIQSAPGQGTTVWIEIPILGAVREEQDRQKLCV